MMEKYIPYEKLSKKEKRKIDSCRRKTWGNLNPVTRKPANSKAYNRKKNQYWKDQPHSTDSFLLSAINSLVRNVRILHKYRRNGR